MAHLGIDFVSTAAATASCDVAAHTGGTLTVRRWQHNDVDLDTSDASDRVIVVLNLTPAPKVIWHQAGCWTSKAIEFGSFSVIAAADPVEVTVTGPTDVLLIFLPTTLFDQTAGIADLRRATTRFIDRNAAIERVCLRMLVTLQRRGGSHETVLEPLAKQLADLLVHDRPVTKMVGGLPAYRLARLCRYVEARVQEDRSSAIRLRDMAEVAGLSPYHFSRAFKQSTGNTPAAFVMRRRLEFGRIALATSTNSVSSIARRLGFPSPAHFTQRFKEGMGVVPSEFREAMGPVAKREGSRQAFDYPAISR